MLMDEIVDRAGRDVLDAGLLVDCGQRFSAMRLGSGSLEVAE